MTSTPKAPETMEKNDAQSPARAREFSLGLERAGEIAAEQMSDSTIDDLLNDLRDKILVLQGLEERALAELKMVV